MGFFDLCIPYHESDRQVIDKSSLQRSRLKLGLKAMELGYTGVAYNRILKGVMAESDRCSTPLFPLPKLAPSSSSFFASVKFHRELLNVAVSSPFRQYTRLTVIVDMPSQASALNSGNPVIKSYDIVAVRPMTQNAFDQACQTSEVDMIAIEFSDKLPFRLKQPMVKAAIKRGVYFEITYSGLVADAQARRQMISNCKLLVDWTRGKNLIISSSAPSVTELRGPQDVSNLFSLLGLSAERAKAAISKNCRSLLTSALRKKHFHKETIKVEQIPSDVQHSPFDDWLKWDPISSGDGDVLLDDMEKSFSIANSQTKPVKKPINFASRINSLPAQGLQIKDIISVSKAAAAFEPPETIINTEPVAMEIEKSETPEENQGHSVTNISKEQDGVDEDSKASLDYDPISEETIPISSENPNHSELLDYVPISEETIPISSENPNHLESKPVASEIQSPYQVPAGNNDLSNTLENRCGEGVSDQDVYTEGGERYSERTDIPVKLGDGLPTEGLLKTDANVIGRERRKGNPPHRHLLFPFKRSLKPRPSKRKFPK